ncbi:MAG: AAA family ATPase [Myxococcaceae bacterium]|nr:AAA family ATPase [Myxococcaceae bacterium]
MYVSRVTLTNIRGFQRLEFDFERPDESFEGWTVITGDNGSGKSALLKAIAVALMGRDTARSLEPTFHRWIREGTPDNAEAAIEVGLVRNPDEDSLSTGGAPPHNRFSAKILLKNVGGEVVLEEATSRGQQKRKTPQRTIWAPDARGWFSCGYGPFRRVFGASPEATRQMVSPSTTRFVTMFQEAASLAEVDEWLRRLKHKSLENQTAEGQQLEILLSILRDDLLPNEITVDGVNADGLWLKDRNGVRLSWREMSDGYRSSLALLADIVRHMIKVHGAEELLGKTPDGHVFVRKSGVILIDEVDAHLHPEWQREIGFWLRRHFPKVQFIVTTHSPLICQAADPNGLFVLPEPGSGLEPRRLSAEEHAKIIASRPDTILLTPAFGLQNTRSPLAVERRKEFDRLKAKTQAGARLSPAEEQRWQQLELFVESAEDE